MKTFKLSCIILTVLLIGTGCNVSKKNITQTLETKHNTTVTEAKEKVKIDEYVSAECSWAFDVTDPQAVMENTDYFVKVHVKTKEKTKYFVKNTIMPNSVYNVKIIDVVSPKNVSLPKNIKLAVNGGVVSMEEYANTLDEDTKEKTNTKNLSKKDAKKMIMISNEAYYELEQGNDYYICIRDLTDDADYKGYYGMPEGGYDVFLKDNEEYVNVLTNNKFIP
ncbi:MAG: hypothetical protein K6G65_04635 [Lachnospiraceae bacterium]|nr:hypothetical protein [Lachnospiraceae bacterium]